MSKKTEALTALHRLVEAAKELNAIWDGDVELDDVLTPGYPQALPSFDEYVLLLSKWQEDASKR